MDFCGVHLLLREWKVSEDVFIANMAKPMLEKFEKYWMGSNKLLCIATILDPFFFEGNSRSMIYCDFILMEQNKEYLQGR